jgi:hypothetical protein
VAVGAQLHDERREIGVAGRDAEGIELLRVEQFHRVDHQRHVGGVLAARIAELLDRADRMFVEPGGPALQPRARPIAISAADVGDTIFGKLRQHRRDLAVRDIVGIDQQSDAAVRRGLCGQIGI